MNQRFGPGFLSTNSTLYRIEYGMLTILTIALLHWVYNNQGLSMLATTFFLIFPDFVFIPILLSMKNGKWPFWGSASYNISHSILTLVIAYLVFWIILGQIYWPILGWMLHITADRTLGYTLRM